MANSAQPASGGATYRVLRELGSRAHRTFAAIREPHELLVVQRFARSPTHGGKVRNEATPVSAEALAPLLRDARCLAKNWHPNVARLRHVDLGGPELFIATDVFDAVPLSDLMQDAAAQRTNPRDPVLSLPLVVRILVDVLGGLRDGMSAPLGAIHGELCPANIIVSKPARRRSDRAGRHRERLRARRKLEDGRHHHDRRDGDAHGAGASRGDAEAAPDRRACRGRERRARADGSATGHAAVLHDVTDPASTVASKAISPTTTPTSAAAPTKPLTTTTIPAARPTGSKPKKKFEPQGI